MAKKLFDGQLGSVELEIKITSHSGKELDFSENIILLEVIEDITNLSTVGSFVFIDTQGIKEFLPLIGGEKIKISFRTNSDFDEWENDFIIIKIGKEEQIKNQTPMKQIQVYFASEPFYTNFKQKISKSFSHKNISEIVDTLYNKILKGKKEIDLESTIVPISYIAPWEYPLDIIVNLMKRAISSSTKKGGFLFYEDKDKYYFKTLDKIYKQKSDKKITFTDIQKQDGTSNVGYIGIVDYYEHIKSFDIISNLKSGVQGSSFYTFDYATKNFMFHSINYENILENSKIGKNATIKSGEIYKESNVEDFEDYFIERLGDGVEFQKNIEEYAKICLYNRFIYNTLNENAIVVGKNGDSELTCGMIIEVDYRSFDVDEKLNERLFGNFLVKSVRHKIDLQDGYKQVCMLTKPFFTKDPDSITTAV